MKGLILAAGLGARLRPLTAGLPKPLLPILTRPNLHHALSWMSRCGVAEVGINLHYQADRLRAFVGDGSRWGVSVTFREEQELLQYGVLALFDGFLQDDPVLILNGDVVIDLDGSRLLAAHRERRAQATLVVVDRPHALHPVYWGPDERLLGIRGTAPVGSGPVSAGTYTGVQILEPEARRLGVPAPVVANMATEVYPRLLAGGLPLQVFVHRRYWSDVGSLASYWQTHLDLLQRPLPHYTRGLLPRGLGLWVSPEARLGAGIEWSPPVAVGAGAVLDHYVFLGPYAVVGEGARLGRGCRVERAVVWERVEVAPGEIVRDCVHTGEAAHPLLGAGRAAESAGREGGR